MGYPLVRGAYYAGGGQVQLPQGDEFGDYSGRLVTVKTAVALNWWSEAERKIERSGRPRGTKNYAGRSYRPDDIRRLFGRIDLAVTSGTARAIAASKEAIAKEMISIVSAQSKFNDYTGNLTSSYMATIVTSRKISGRVVYEAKKRSSIHVGPKGGRYAFLSRERHKPRGFKYRGIYGPNKKYKDGPKLLTKNGQVIRYLRKWERTGQHPYIDGGIGPKGSTINVGYLNRESGKIQSGIVIENTAPYSGAVQRRHYNVLKGAVSRASYGGRWSHNAEKLVRVATIQALKDAGLKIK